MIDTIKYFGGLFVLLNLVHGTRVCTRTCAIVLQIHRANYVLHKKSVRDVYKIDMKIITATAIQMTILPRKAMGMSNRGCFSGPKVYNPTETKYEQLPSGDRRPKIAHT